LQTGNAASQSKLSIVIPVRNESANVEELHRRLTSVLGELGVGYEIIFVDDGSEDDTREKIRSLMGDRGGRVKLLGLSRSFGHQAALRAGLDAAAGEAVITMDGDLQHPPQVIGELLEKWRDGFEVVYTVRKDDPSANWFRRLGVGLAYRFINLCSDWPIPPHAADFRLLDRRAVEAVKQMGDVQPVLRSQVVWIGFRRAAVEYQPARRYAGRRQYSLRQLRGLVSGAIWGYSARPLRAVHLAGWGFIISAIVASFVAAPWPAVLILLVAGVQLLALVVVAQYVVRTHSQSLGRPLYIIREKAGFDERQN